MNNFRKKFEVLNSLLNNCKIRSNWFKIRVLNLYRLKKNKFNKQERSYLRLKLTAIDNCKRFKN